MNGLDLFIVVVLLVGLARGFATGIIRQVAGVVGLVLGFVLSVRLMNPMGTLVVSSLGVSERIAPVIGFVLVFITVQTALFFLVRIVEALVGALKLTVFNRVAGGVVGAFQAALLLSVLFLVLGVFGVPGRPTQRASHLYTPVSSALPVAWNFVSSRVPGVEALTQRFRLPEPPQAR